MHYIDLLENSPWLRPRELINFRPSTQLYSHIHQSSSNYSPKQSGIPRAPLTTSVLNCPCSVFPSSVLTRCISASSGMHTSILDQPILFLFHFWIYSGQGKVQLWRGESDFCCRGAPNDCTTQDCWGARCGGSFGAWMVWEILLIDFEEHSVTVLVWRWSYQWMRRLQR
jgi:hypothetical protein